MHRVTPTSTRSIAATLTRLQDLLDRRPARARSTARSVATLGPGLRCRCDESTLSIECDLPVGLGGEASGPTPTALLRAALGACLAIGYRLHAAEVGVELTSVRVTIESETDVRGMLDVGGGHPVGFETLRAHAELESPAPASAVRRVVERADRLSPLLELLTKPVPIERTVSIRSVA